MNQKPIGDNIIAKTESVSSWSFLATGTWKNMIKLNTDCIDSSLNLSTTDLIEQFLISQNQRYNIETKSFNKGELLSVHTTHVSGKEPTRKKEKEKIMSKKLKICKRFHFQNGRVL